MAINPCDVCKSKLCQIDGEDCILDVYAYKCWCYNDECFLNHDTICVLGFYEKCGAWEE